MATPIGAPSVGKDAMKSKFDPVITPRKPFRNALKLNKGGTVKKQTKGAARGR